MRSFRSFVLVFILFVVCLAACTSADSTSKTDTSRLIPEPDINERLSYSKNVIDSFINHNKDKLYAYAKLSNADSLIKIADTVEPDSLETTYYIIKDTSGHIIWISEHPHSESGDWFVLFNHYFDKDGRTFAFERQVNQFNSGCTEGVSYETTTKFYDAGFKMVDSSYRLVDDKNKALKKDSCSGLSVFEYIVAPTLTRLLDSTRIGKTAVAKTLH